MPATTRIPASARTLDAPLLSFKLEDEVRRLHREPEWIAGDKNGITLAKNPHLRAVLVTLKRGARLGEYRPEGPVTVSVLSGKVSVNAGGASRTVGAKGFAALRRGMLHNVRALENAVLLLTIVCL